MKKYIFGGVAAALMLVPLMSHGFQILKDDAVGFGAVITAKGNRYIGGGNLSVNDATLGDMFAAGGTVAITSSTTGDLVVAGGNVSISGAIGDDARIAGGNLTIAGPIGGDLLAAGGQVRVERGVTIGGEAGLSGGTLVIDGTIRGDAMIAAESVVINGTLEGDADIRAMSLTFGDSAVANGAVKYVGPREAVVKDGALVGPIDYTKSEGREAGRRGGFALGSWLFKFLVMAIAALVLYFLFERRDDKDIRGREFGLDVVRGIVLLITIPIAAVILLVTLVGAWVGLAGLALFVLFVLIAVGYVGILAGRLLSQFVLHRKLDWKIVVLGVLSVEIAVLIPFVGWLACFALFLAAFGLIFKKLYAAVRR